MESPNIIGYILPRMDFAREIFHENFKMPETATLVPRHPLITPIGRIRATLRLSPAS